MKKSFALFTTLVSCMLMFTASTNRGGDVLQIYLNGRQVHQQFIQVDKTVKTLHLANLSPKDKIKIYYSHCGYAGKNRLLVFKNTQNDLVKEIKFSNAAEKQARMQFQPKEVTKAHSGVMKLYYSSQELPQARWIATISWSNTNTTATAGLL